MGKIKRKRTNFRNNPLAFIQNGQSQTLDTQEFKNTVRTTSKSSYLQNILDQLQSPVAEIRDSGLNSLSLAAQNEKILGEIIEENLASVAGPLLNDPSAMVRHSACGALRNLSAGGPLICDQMISQDVMTHLIRLLKEKYQEWTPNLINKTAAAAPENTEKKIDTMTETFVEAINLLMNLCDYSERAILIFNTSNLVDLLKKYMNFEIFGFKVSTAISQCFYTISEDKNSINNINIKDILTQIIENLDPSICSSDGLFFLILCAGILINLNNGEILRLSSLHFTKIMTIISSVLNQDQITLINAFSSKVPLKLKSVNGHGHNKQEEKSFEIPDDLVESYEILSNVLNAQQVSLELLANSLCMEEEDEDIEVGSDGGNDDDDDSFENLEDSNGNENEENMDQDVVVGPLDSLPENIQEAFTKNDLLSKVLNKFSIPPENVKLILNDNAEHGKSILRNLDQLRCTALLCFQNINSEISIANREEMEKLRPVLSSLQKYLIDAAESKNVDLIEAVSSAMHSITQKWVESKMNFLDFLSALMPSDFNVYCEIYEKFTIDKIRVNIIKIIGGIGILASRTVVEEMGALLTEIAKFLLSSLSKNTSDYQLYLSAEILDTIFDVFAEDDYNKIINDLKMIQKLKSFLPLFKRNVKARRKHLGENRAIILTVNDNLIPFIDYKIKNGCK